jgi:hypothetical protein
MKTTITLITLIGFCAIVSFASTRIGKKAASERLGSTKELVKSNPTKGFVSEEY